MIQKKIKTFSVETQYRIVEAEFDKKINKWLEENPSIEILDMKSSATENEFILHVLYN